MIQLGDRWEKLIPNLHKNPFAWISIFYGVWVYLYSQVSGCHSSINPNLYFSPFDALKVLVVGPILIIFSGFAWEKRGIGQRRLSHYLSHYLGWESKGDEFSVILSMIAILFLIVLISSIIVCTQQLKVCSWTKGLIESGGK